MKIIIAATPFSSHITPIAGMAQMLVSAGHEVVGYTGSKLQAAIERTGARFHPLPKAVDFDLRDVDQTFPERRKHTAGIETLLFDLNAIFIGPMAEQYRELKALLAAFDADVVISEHFFYGAVPMLFMPRKQRPALIGLGITFLALPRQDGAPHGPALPFTTDPAIRAIYEAEATPSARAVVEPLQKLYLAELARLGIDAGETRFDDAHASLADAFWQSTVPSFEYPQAAVNPRVKFIGAVPAIQSGVPLPEWAGDIAVFDRKVLITQGTIANGDFSKLVAPSIKAFANEPDTLVIVTGGGRDIPDLGFDLPANTRIASYLPFDWLVPQVDLLITNGGYGTINQALAAGVPIIVAGTTEDKSEVSARIAWSGVGINLETERPTSEAIREAAHQILDRDRSYINRAREFALEFKEYDSRTIILDTLAGVVPALQK